MNLRICIIWYQETGFTEHFIRILYKTDEVSVNFRLIIYINMLIGIAAAWWLHISIFTFYHDPNCPNTPESGSGAICFDVSL